MEEVYYSKASLRPDYKKSPLHIFHIILKEKGEDFIINSSVRRYDTEAQKIKYRMYDKKFHSRKLWTKEEEEYLMHSDDSLKIKSQNLNRSTQSLIAKIHWMEGKGFNFIRHYETSYWTKEDCNYVLNSHDSIALKAERLGRSINAVHCKLSELRKREASKPKNKWNYI